MALRWKSDLSQTKAAQYFPEDVAHLRRQAERTAIVPPAEPTERESKLARLKRELEAAQGRAAMSIPKRMIQPANMLDAIKGLPSMGKKAAKFVVPKYFHPGEIKKDIEQKQRIVKGEMGAREALKYLGKDITKKNLAIIEAGMTAIPGGKGVATGAKLGVKAVPKISKLAKLKSLGKYGAIEGAAIGSLGLAQQAVEEEKLPTAKEAAIGIGAGVGLGAGMRGLGAFAGKGRKVKKVLREEEKAKPFIPEPIKEPTPPAKVMPAEIEPPAKPLTTVSEDLQPLAKEARKYDTAFDFIDAIKPEGMSMVERNKYADIWKKAKLKTKKTLPVKTKTELGIDKDKPEYGMGHRPSKTGGTGDDITKKGEVMSEDVYQHPEWYGNMDDKTYQESFETIRKMKGKPEKEITIYRASPKSEINEGDWVTLSKKYAEGEALAEKVPVNKFKVKAKDIQFAGDDINEFGYYPKKAKVTPKAAKVIPDIIKQAIPEKKLAKDMAAKAVQKSVKMKYTADGGQANILSKLEKAQGLPAEVAPEIGGVAKTKVKEKLKSSYVKNIVKFIDRFEPIKRIAGKKEYTKSYVGARLLGGKIKGKTEMLMDDFYKGLKPLKGGKDTKLLDTIYAARYFRDVDKAGKTTSNVTAEMATGFLDNLKGKVGKKKYDRVAGVADFIAGFQNKRGLSMLEKAGIITKQQSKTYKKTYPNYMRSEVIRDEMNKGFPGLLGKSGAEPMNRIDVSFLKKKKGTPQEIRTDVLNLTRESLLAKTAASEKQKVMNQVAKEFGKDVGTVKFGEGMAVKSKKYTNAIPEGFVELPAKTTDGKIYAVPDEVGTMINGMNREEADIVTNAISGYNKIFRMGATTTRVPFVISNMMRDVQEAFFKKRTKVGGVKIKEIPGLGTIKNYTTALYESVANAFGVTKKHTREFKEAGAGYGGMITELAKAKTLPFRLKTPIEKVKTSVSKVVASPLNAVSKIGEIGENTTRLAEFIRTGKAKIDPDLRALSARDITVDFEKRGEAMKIINRWIPFLNARVQGNVNTLRAFKDQPVKSMMRLASYIVMPAIGLYSWNNSFENDKQIAPWIKQNYWYLNTGMKITTGEGEQVPFILTFRKGEVAEVFAKYTDLILGVASQEKKGKQKLAEYFKEELSLGNQAYDLMNTIMPPPIKVGAELMTNKSFFYKSDIVPSWMEKLEPKYQARYGTSDTARALGEKLNVSPAKLEHAAKGTYPAIRQFTDILDTMIKPKGMIAKQDKRTPIEKASSYLPVYKTPSGYSEESEGMYKFKEEEAEGKATEKYLAREAYKIYLKNGTSKNKIQANKALKQLSSKDKKYAIKKAREDLAKESALPEEKAWKSLNKEEQKKYQSAMGKMSF